MSFVNRIKKLFRKDNTEDNKDKKDEKLNAFDYIGKFVKQNGADMGESVAVSNTRFIVKNKDGFVAVPVQAIVKNENIIEVGDFNMEESIKLGKEWDEKKDILKFDEKGMLILEKPK